MEGAHDTKHHWQFFYQSGSGYGLFATARQCHFFSYIIVALDNDLFTFGSVTLAPNLVIGRSLISCCVASVEPVPQQSCWLSMIELAISLTEETCHGNVLNIPVLLQDTYILDSGLDGGLELPYTCRGGICG